MKTIIMRRWLQNSLLLLLFGWLLGLVLWQDHKQDSHENHLLTADLSQLNKIILERYPDTPQTQKLSIIKQDKQWLVKHEGELKGVAVDTAKLQQLLSLTYESVVRQYETNTLDLRDYALLPGYVRLTFYFQDAVQVTQEQLTLGMSHPVSGLRYILHDGQMKLVNEAVFALLMDEHSF